MAKEQTDKYRRELIDRVKSSVSFPSGLDPEKSFSAVMCTLSARINRGEAVDVTRTVFQAIRDWIPAKEFKDIESELSKDLKTIWRAA